MSHIIGLTGASGNMGIQALYFLMQSKEVSKVKCLLLNEKRERKDARKWKKLYKDRIEIIFGNIKDYSVVQQLVEGTDYVMHLAAVIPPKADHYAKETDDCNRIGTINIVDAISSMKEHQPKLVHISTVAVYGDRNYKHPWGRIGDPLLPSCYDEYATSKIKGERYVLDSDIKEWVILRQTGILHNRMLTDNMSDGLMFHTCYNVPIEWVTAHDSGILLQHLVEKDAANKLKGFWKKAYNIGGGASMRITGYDTFNDGFKIIGGSTEKFMKPNWNATRNFHCMWYLDSDLLNDYLDFRTQDLNTYWKEVADTHKYFALAKLFPPKLISKLAIERLIKNNNAPLYWYNHHMDGRVIAAFKDNPSNMTTKWEDFPLLAKGMLPDGTKMDYDEIRDIKKVKKHNFIISHGYDETKKDSELDIEDMRNAAEFRGGKCLSTSMTKGDLYTKLEWECHEGHHFWASPYTILKAGHWCPTCSLPEPWNFDKLAKVSKFHAQIWYDSHNKDEDYIYWFDENHNPQYKKI